MKIIIPSSDLRNKYNEVSKLTLEEQKPVYITVNGRGDTVLINQTVYETQMAELELLRLLAEGQDSYLKKDYLDTEPVFKNIKKELK